MNLTPKVLADTERELVVEESHLPGWLIAVAVVVLAGAFVVPAVRSGSMSGVFIGLGFATVLVGLPFLSVLAASRYRRLEVRPGVEVVCEVVPRLAKRRTERVAWAEVVKVVCERTPGGHRRPTGLRLTLHPEDGPPQRVLQGWWSDELVAALRKHLGDKFSRGQSFL